MKANIFVRLMRQSVLCLAVLVLSSFALAAANKVYTDSADIYDVLKANPEIQAVPVAAQLTFGKPVLVTSVTLIQTTGNCFQRAKVTFIQAGQGNQPRESDSSEEFNLKNCAVVTDGF